MQQRFFAALLASIFIVTAAPHSGAFVASADSSGGYSGMVLEKILPYWQPPAGRVGMAKILIRISDQGRVLSCQAWRPGIGMPRVQSQPIAGTSASVAPLQAPPASLPEADVILADSLCMAVARAGDFAVPPYAMVTEVSVFASTDGSGRVSVPPSSGAPVSSAAQAPAGQVPMRQAPALSAPPLSSGSLPINTPATAPQGSSLQPSAQLPGIIPASQSPVGSSQAYAEDVMRRVRAHIMVPGVIDKPYTTVVRLHVRADGHIEQISVNKPSGSNSVDEAVLRAFATPNVTLPTPDGRPAEMMLTFTMRPK